MKFGDFSVTQISREIKFAELRNSKPIKMAKMPVFALLESSKLKI